MLIHSYAEDLRNSIGRIAKMDGVSVINVDGSSTKKTSTGHANVGIDEDMPEQTYADSYNTENNEQPTNPVTQRLAPYHPGYPRQEYQYEYNHNCTYDQIYSIEWQISLVEDGWGLRLDFGDDEDHTEAYANKNQ